MFFVGNSSGFRSCIDGTPGDENPRTNPIQKYDSDTHIDSVACKNSQELNNF